MYHIIVTSSADTVARKKWEKAEPRFKDSKKPYQVHYTASEADITNVVEQITWFDEAGADDSPDPTNLVVFGGDGTLNYVLNGIRDFSKVRIGYVPAGTGNDFARDIDILGKDDETIDRILAGKVVRTTDLGELVYKQGTEKHRRYFHVSAGIGYDAAICAHVDRSFLKPCLHKLGIGKIIYPLMAAKLLFQTPMVSVKVTLDKKRKFFLDKTLFIVCMNHRFEGGGFEFCPDADASDGQIELCMASGLRRLSFFRIFPKVYKGEHGGYTGIELDHAKFVHIRSSIPMWIHTDGEAFTMASDLGVRLIPGALHFIM